MWPWGVCQFLAGIVVALAGVWFTHVKNAVTRNEMNDAIAANTGSFVSALRANGVIMAELSKQVQRLEVTVAVLVAGGRLDAGHTAGE